MRTIRAFLKIIITPFRFILKKIYTLKVRIEAKEIKGKLTVNKKSKVTRFTVLGENVNFNGLRIEGQGSVIIGNNFHSGTECLFITSFHNYDSGTKIPYDSTYIHKPIIIEDNVWLGSRVLVLGGVNIGEGAIIQAGSVVVSNIPNYSIAGGSPAKVFKMRDAEHYRILKEKNQFH